ncbi:hypothetical protein Vafri_22212 [Volvox africanus]|uniref:Uncharacterized protein n=1 Tax=Volvox africanus TaxID=51714 RepID=A0A8J4C0G3_9CHLO|nr:hypothetical protein Vafri_22212 [Volvox africanus]
MSLSRQAMQTGLRRIGPRLSYPLHISHLYKLCARAAEHYGPQQAVARPERPKTTGPAVSLSGSESDSDSDDSFPLMEAEQQQDRAPKALGKWAGVGSIGGIIVLLGAGVILKDAIREFLVRWAALALGG